MIAEKQTYRTVLRNVGSKKIFDYLTQQSDRQKLQYHEGCLGNIQNPQSLTEMVGLDCQMIQTNIGPQLVKLMIIDAEGEVYYYKWFNIAQGTTVTDYITHITGIDQNKMKNISKYEEPYGESDRKKIQKLVEGKIIVGHDLTNDLSLLKINHQAFIDTVALIPHPYGLPFKSKLKFLAMEYLDFSIQQSCHDPYEDALAALKIVQTHIKSGKGIMQTQPFEKKSYENPMDILRDAELDVEKVQFFVLRGSRALGLDVDCEQYQSDYDYIVVYNTPYDLNGKLLKLPNIDLSFFDINSFQKQMFSSDLSLIQAFFLPKKFTYINRLTFPQLNLMDLQKSLYKHLKKSNNKTQRLQGEIDQNPAYKWKIFKAQHLRIRFMDNFIQLTEQIIKNIRNLSTDQRGIKRGQSIKINIHRMSYLWHEIKEEYEKNKNYEQIIQKLTKIQNEKMQEVKQSERNIRILKKQIIRRSRRQTINLPRKEEDKRYNLMENILSNRLQQSENYRRRGYAMRGRYRRRGGYRMRRVCWGRNRYPQIINDRMISSYEFDSSGQITHFPLHESLSVVRLLRHESFEALEDYKISSKSHEKFPLIQLKHVNCSNFKTNIARQCCGIILNQSRNYEVVAYPYKKFFDYNDPDYSEKDEFDWESAKVYEKKDGSLAFLYYYGKWNVASSSVPDGTNKYCFIDVKTEKSFGEEFWRIFNELQYKQPSVEDISKTFIFQVMSKDHQIVVNRQKSELFLHGVRDRITLMQQDHIKYAYKYNWQTTKPLQLSKQQLNLQNIVKMAQQLDPLQNQGFVVVDKNWVRMKVRNSQYLHRNYFDNKYFQYHPCSVSYKIHKLVVSGKYKTYLQYCPNSQFKEGILNHAKKLQDMNKQIGLTFSRFQNLGLADFEERIKNYSKNMKEVLQALRQNRGKYMGTIQNILTSSKFFNFIQNWQIKNKEYGQQVQEKEKMQISNQGHDNEGNEGNNEQRYSRGRVRGTGRGRGRGRDRRIQMGQRRERGSMREQQIPQTEPRRRRNRY